jgi:hypothetical protein
MVDSKPQGGEGVVPDSGQKILREWLSAIAIPLVVMFVGGKVQSAIAHQGASKDYVAIAVSILKDPAITGSAVEDDRALVKWASVVLDANSPVPFPRSTRAAMADKGKAAAEASPVARYIVSKARADKS